MARALYAAVEVGQEIPAHMYRAVAEILAYIFKLDEREIPRPGVTKRPPERSAGCLQPICIWLVKCSGAAPTEMKKGIQKIAKRIGVVVFGLGLCWYRVRIRGDWNREQRPAGGGAGGPGVDVAGLLQRV